MIEQFPGQSVGESFDSIIWKNTTLSKSFNIHLEIFNFINTIFPKINYLFVILNIIFSYLNTFVKHNGHALILLHTLL